MGASQKDKQTELRSQSFREQTGSPRLERSDRQNSLPPPDSNSAAAAVAASESPTASADDVSATDAGGSDTTSLGGSTTPTAANGGPKKRLQRVEILKIVDSPPMIEPSQVVVNKAQVLVADPIVTPFEMLRQKVNSKYSRQSARFFPLSSKLGLPPPPYPQASVFPPPLVGGGGGVQTRWGRWVGGILIPTRGQMLWYSRYICALW
jgi:hypothetical protein